MQNTIQFINQFSHLEFTANRAKYDINVSDSEYSQLALAAYHCYHPSVPNPYGRGMTVTDLEEDPDWAALCRAKIPKIKERVLFQVRKYENALIGEALGRSVTSKDLYGCLLSYDQDAGRPLFLSSEYFVAETPDGLKIIYDRSFNTKDGTWSHSHDHAPTRVEDPGTLVEVQNFVAPEDEASLKEYLRVAPQ